MSRPTLSVVTASYNQGDYIEENLESVMSQSYDAVEHIVVDGGSTDGTVDLLEEYEGSYNLKWISESDRGQSHALNKGIDMATGDWIAFQMSDDYYLNGAFATAVDAIERNPDADIVYGDILNVDSEGNEQARTYNIPPVKFVQRYWSLYANSQATFFRAEVLDKSGGFREELEYTMDADLYWRLLHTDITQVHVPELLAAFRYHEAAKTPSRSNEQETAEWDEIYGETYERYLSTAHLQTVAKVIKAIQLLRIGRFEAFRYNLRSLI